MGIIKSTRTVSLEQQARLFKGMLCCPLCRGPVVWLARFESWTCEDRAVCSSAFSLVQFRL